MIEPMPRHNKPPRSEPSLVLAMPRSVVFAVIVEVDREPLSLTMIPKERQVDRYYDCERMKPSKTALFEAAKRWEAAAVKALLKSAPALVDATDPKGRQALHMACAVSPDLTLGEANGIATVKVLLAAAPTWKPRFQCQRR